MMATYRVRGWSLDAWGFQGQTDAPRWSFRHDVTRLRRRPHARGRTGNKALRSGSESGSGSFARPGPSHGRLPAGWLLLACRVLYAVFGSVAIRVFLDRPSSVSGLPPWSWPHGICGPPRTPAEKTGTWSVSEDTSHVSKPDKAREIQPSGELGLFRCHATHKLSTLGCNFLFYLF
jgi:hypothetical protein